MSCDDGAMNTFVTNATSTEQDEPGAIRGPEHLAQATALHRLADEPWCIAASPRSCRPTNGRKKQRAALAMKEIRQP